MASESFGEQLYALIEAKGMTVPAFAELVGFTKQSLSNIRHGHRPAPLERLEGWADALELQGLERDLFLDRGALTHCPERIQELHRLAERTRGISVRALLEADVG